MRVISTGGGQEKTAKETRDQTASLYRRLARSEAMRIAQISNHRSAFLANWPSQPNWARTASASNSIPRVIRVSSASKTIFARNIQHAMLDAGIPQRRSRRGVQRFGQPQPNIHATFRNIESDSRDRPQPTLTCRHHGVPLRSVGGQQNLPKMLIQIPADEQLPHDRLIELRRPKIDHRLATQNRPTQWFRQHAPTDADPGR